MPLITTSLSALLLSQVFNPRHSPIICPIFFELWDTVSNVLTKARMYDIHCCPFIYLFGHAFAEGYQMSQSRLTLSKSMPATPDNCLFLHTARDGHRNELFHHLTWDGGQADWPVVAWAFLVEPF